MALDSPKSSDDYMDVDSSVMDGYSTPSAAANSEFHTVLAFSTASIDFGEDGMELDPQPTFCPMAVHTRSTRAGIFSGYPDCPSFHIQLPCCCPQSPWTTMTTTIVVRTLLGLVPLYLVL
ncbi:hypothetical protein D9758_016375 [Tetrapyrgos nigripes]|uniref:Uncharacterized protein n=1 Tax=Tetrapyrgos nigripes TaxID=182062 RepID=A0A8H5CE03_9AGAR|nr:hypothetical protein D9758_016375 [Tetrapyrgos nigripes]